MISYKQRWQEANQEVERLRAEVEGLCAEVERTKHVVDLAGIARHMLVTRYTPQQWRQRGHLPPVDFPDIREPLWYASTIKEHFADRTNRIWHDDPSRADEDDVLDARHHTSARLS